MGITEGTIYTGALATNRVTWEAGKRALGSQRPLVELEVKCPICGVVVRTVVVAERVEYSNDPHWPSKMKIEGAPVDLSAHLVTAHSDAQWRAAYFKFRPVDAVAEESSAHTHGWRQG